MGPLPEYWVLSIGSTDKHILDTVPESRRELVCWRWMGRYTGRAGKAELNQSTQYKFGCCRHTLAYLKLVLRMRDVV